MNYKCPIIKKDNDSHPLSTKESEDKHQLYAPSWLGEGFNLNLNQYCFVKLVYRTHLFPLVEQWLWMTLGTGSNTQGEAPGSSVLYQWSEPAMRGDLHSQSERRDQFGLRHTDYWKFILRYSKHTLVIKQ